MSASNGRPARLGLEAHGIDATRDVHWNPTTAVLVEHAIRREEGQLTDAGALSVATGKHTGRSPQDRFIVREPSTEAEVWWGSVNVPLEPAQYETLAAKARAVLAARDLYVTDAWCGADPAHRIGVRMISTSAWHSHFARNMFIQPSDAELEAFPADWTILHAPEALADPATDGTHSETFIVLNFAERTVLIGGTWYAGEIKKSVFGVMNFLLPPRGVLPMHCSANVGPDGDVALFFGLSGTGKTTLSADPGRQLIGDDEHGCGPNGVFNFEGGCYAKTIGITEASEPQIFRATNRFGTIIENVPVDPLTRVPDFTDDSLTENTRSSYPLDHLDHLAPQGSCGLPRHIVFLTADAFGVLPPIAALTREQAMYHFLSGYTARVAGTERGVKEPTSTFSTCFGAPFFPRHPGVYAEMLGDLMASSGARVWLVNTGWTGGPYGSGTRMRLELTRAMLTAALTGALDDVPTRPHPVFGMGVPSSVPGVPDDVLDPRNTWADPAAYDRTAADLAGRFEANFAKYADGVSMTVRQAGPLVR